MVVAAELTDVLVAGYQTVDAANKDFDALIERVKAKSVRVEAAILVAHDRDGNVTVQKTGDNIGHTGLKWGGSVGFLVGLAQHVCFRLNCGGFSRFALEPLLGKNAVTAFYRRS